MDKQKALGTEPVKSLLFKYSLPAIISLVVNALYVFVDRIFIGNIPDIGALAITGVGITVPIQTILLAFSIAVAAGTSTNMSLKLGEGKKEEASALVGNAITLAFIIGVVLTVAYFFARDWLLGIFGATEGSIQYARDYMNILVFGSVPWMLAMALNFAIRADGNPTIAAAIMIIGAFVNIPLDALFIFGLGWGIQGAAIATVIAETVSMVLSLLYYFGGKSNLEFNLSFLKLRSHLVKMIVSIGFTPFIIQIAISASQAVTNNALKIYGGDLAIGAMTTIGAVVMLFFMPVFGLTQGMQPIVGYNYGSGNRERARAAFFRVVIWGTVFLSVGTFVIQVFPHYVVGIFNSDPELMAITIDGIRKDTFTLPLVALSIAGSSYILSIGKARLAMVLSLLRQIIVLIPALIILPRFLGLDGVWFSQPVGDVVALIITVTVLYYEFRSYKKTEKI